MLNLQNGARPLRESIHILHDWLMVFVISISTFTLLCIAMVKWNAYINSKVENQYIELVWSVAPIGLLLFIVYPSLKLLYLTETPNNNIAQKTIGHQWYWQYDGEICYDSYLNRGYRLLSVDQRLHLPLLPVNMFITAADVLHSWTLPTIGVKADAIPGRINRVVINNKRHGVYFGQCREICGSNHSFIPIVIETIFNYYFILKINSRTVKIKLAQLLCILVCVAFYTLLERKLLAYTQIRKGPNKPRISGLFTPIRDALKLLKERNRPTMSNKIIYHITPVFALVLSMGLWALYPSLSIKYSLFWFLCITALGVYALMGAGWRRNRKYTTLGAIRAIAQSISYEVVLSFLLLHLVIFWNFELFIVRHTMLFLFSAILLLFVTLLAETNRSPFDFSEGESELVSGFNTEFSAIPFMMIFLAEYMSIMFISLLIRSFTREYYLFTIFWAITFVWTRGTLPRIRYDQLMSHAWKSFLPISLGTLTVVFLR